MLGKELQWPTKKIMGKTDLPNKLTTRLKQLYKLQICCPLPIESFLHLMTFLLEAISLLSNLFHSQQRVELAASSCEWRILISSEADNWEVNEDEVEEDVPRIDGGGPSDNDEERRGKSEWSRTLNI